MIALTLEPFERIPKGVQNGCVCNLLLFRQVRRLRSITLLIVAGFGFGFRPKKKGGGFGFGLGLKTKGRIGIGIRGAWICTSLVGSDNTTCINLSWLFFGNVHRWAQKLQSSRAR